MINGIVSGCTIPIINKINNIHIFYPFLQSKSQRSTKGIAGGHIKQNRKIKHPPHPIICDLLNRGEWCRSMHRGDADIPLDRTSSKQEETHGKLIF